MLVHVHVWTPISGRFGALAIAALAALAAPGKAAEDAHFACRPTFLGLCRTDYAGPRDGEAAAGYLADARLAAEAALAAHPEVEEVQYRPGSGGLTVIPAAGRTLSPFTLRQIAERFVTARLRLDRVVAPAAGLALRPGRDRGGRSRFMALSRHFAEGRGARDRVGAIEVVSFR